MRMVKFVVYLYRGMLNMLTKILASFYVTCDLLKFITFVRSLQVQLLPECIVYFYHTLNCKLA